MNQALGFIKPHAAASRPVWEAVRSQLEARGLRIHQERLLTGPEIRAGGLIDRHYAVIAQIGTCADPAQLPIDPRGLKTFAEAFGIAWTDAVANRRVISGLETGSRFQWSAPTLMSLWMKHKPVKLGGGFYAAYFPDQAVYVLNGFYPSIREIYTAESAQVRCFLLDFDAQQLSWQAFRDRVIGATDPARAEPDSIRGRLFRDGREYGVTLDFRDNVIHASASPLEAALEKSVWLPGFDPATDPLLQALEPDGWTWTDLIRLGRSNPLISVDGKSVPLIDAMENRDTDPVAEWIRGQGKNS